ncbi:hypothetical protein [Paenibacillus baekrokdamisoli]|uniref:hypothetical protein n=1 Tax=Paenibacillus baekrokdamisoli TaxID=1712516 RepID=UPI001E49E412|nr:hypothetical protein [Paenibacillus baekrokdamisoli]
MNISKIHIVQIVQGHSGVMYRLISSKVKSPSVMLEKGTLSVHGIKRLIISVI